MQSSNKIILHHHNIHCKKIYLTNSFFFLITFSHKKHLNLLYIELHFYTFNVHESNQTHHPLPPCPPHRQVYTTQKPHPIEFVLVLDSIL